MKLGWVIALALACGCSKNNSNYCATAPDHNCNERLDAPPGVDAPQGCQTQTDCTASATPVCDVTQHVCVACSADYATTCPLATPVCNTTTETCRKCAAHSECGSTGACLPDGTCGTDLNVAFVKPAGTDSGTCTAAAPCLTITYALTQAKPYIKVAAGQISDQVTIDQDVTILADAGAKLVAGGGNNAITVTHSHAVAIHDLRITGSDIGVLVGATDTPTLTLDHMIIDDNNGAGINVGGGSITMSRCVLSVNSAGGAIITGTYDITNSIFVWNGNGGSTTGGVTLTPATTSSVFSFNTVADNLSGSTASTVKGINCTIPATLSNNIVTNNPAAPNCTQSYSLSDTGTAMGTNQVGPANYKNTATADPTATDFYRIGAGSTAIDHGDPASTLLTDIDDHMRPAGVTFDIGASEY